MAEYFEEAVWFGKTDDGARHHFMLTGMTITSADQSRAIQAALEAMGYTVRPSGGLNTSFWVDPAVKNGNISALEDAKTVFEELKQNLASADPQLVPIFRGKPLLDFVNRGPA